MHWDGASFACGVVYMAAMNWLATALANRYRRCTVCHKRYRVRKSDSQFKHLMCSRMCEYSDKVEYIAKQTGYSLEDIHQYLSTKAGYGKFSGGGRA